MAVRKPIPSPDRGVGGTWMRMGCEGGAIIHRRIELPIIKNNFLLSEMIHHYRFAALSLLGCLGA